MAASGDRVYVIFNNIPEQYHSSDLRNFFSQFIETKGFACFHFRHRPEVKRRPEGEGESEGCSGSNASDTSPTCCCVAQVASGKMQHLMRMYNRKHWLDREGQTLTGRCFISRVKVAESELHTDKQYKTREEAKEIPPNQVKFTSDDLAKLPELRPPELMPNGNVGTPTLVFLDFIRTCRLPSSIIKKLGLIFPKTRGRRKYGSVPYNYGVSRGNLVHGPVEDEEDEVVLTALGHEIQSVYRKPILEETVSAEKESERVSDSDSEEDMDYCEEWERHEALHNNVTQQERAKERLFEDEIELQWEKGGSGLVFYTDAQYWDAQDGDFDEKTADDWDVDMSIYYEKGAGDKDARDFIQMRHEQRLRQGVETDDTFPSNTGIGVFEKYTKGIGRKVMMNQGWQDGQGLGRRESGIAVALENDGQNPRNKSGFGYHGEKLNRFTSKMKSKRQRFGDVSISTVYDRPVDVISTESLLRSCPTTSMKLRTCSSTEKINL